MNKTWIVIAAGLVAGSGAVLADELISQEEARLPPGHHKAMVLRAITRGPGIQLVSPGADGATVHSPFDLRLEFSPRGTAKIDLDSIKLLYDRNPPVNLIERVRSGLSASGIVVTAAQVPPGKHNLVVSVGDSEGRSTTRVFELTVLP